MKRDGVAAKPVVIFSFLGTAVDAGHSDKRWARWRPTIGLVSPNNEPVTRIELLLNRDEDQALATRVAQDIAAVSPHTQVRVHDLKIQGAWDFAEVYAALHDFVVDYAFSDTEDYRVHLSTGTHVAQICLFLLTESRYFPARLLGTRRAEGAGTAALAWWGEGTLIDLNLVHYDQLASRFAKEQAEHTTLLKGGIATRNTEFNALIGQVEKVSLRSTAPILLTGPTGSGKSDLAGRIYSLKSCKHQVTGPFVEVNCATLRGEGAMSALFGHVKGAFTGASVDRAGLLRRAHQGLLFLDEIGELGLDEQAMLLRALEAKRFFPLGADKEVESDFQLIAGTNQNLEARVQAGQFRADLLARINLWSFELPGLAQRAQDIEPNLDYELARASTELRLNVTMNSQARQAYLSHAFAYRWPGNFREFRSSVLRMATLADGGRITAADVQMERGRLPLGVEVAGRKASAVSAKGLRVLGGAWQDLDLPTKAELEAILSVVECSQSLADAGRALFATSHKGRAEPNYSDRARKTLARYGLKFDQTKELLHAP